MAYRSSRPSRSPFGSRRRNRRGAFILAIAIAGISLFRYCSTADFNEVTGKTQYVGISESQEIALGLQSAPTMIRQYGGLHPNADLQAEVKSVGRRIVNQSDASSLPYNYEFHLLRDDRVVNAFALPGGQVFVTYALYKRFTRVDQLAGVLGHEIGHVVARHGAERIAQQQLSQGLTGAAVVASGDYKTAAAAAMISNLVNMRYGREQELESDDLGVRFIVQAGYDPEALIEVMNILETASGGQRQPEFLSTHPNYENRIGTIREAIARYGG